MKLNPIIANIEATKNTPVGTSRVLIETAQQNLSKWVNVLRTPKPLKDKQSLLESILANAAHFDIPKYYDAFLTESSSAPLNEMYTMSEMLMKRRPVDSLEVDDAQPIVDKVGDVIEYLLSTYGEEDLLDILDDLEKYRITLIHKKANISIVEEPFTDYGVAKALTEQAMLLEAVSKEETYFTISKKFFDEKDASKLITMLPQLIDYFESFDKVTRGAVKNCEILLRYLFHKFVNNPSYLRRFNDKLSLGLVIVKKLPETEHTIALVALVVDKIDYIKKHVAKVITEATEFDYDIIIETGLDEVVELISELAELTQNHGDELLSEGFADIKATVKEKVKRVDQAQKRASRKLDNAFQRVLDDYRKKRKAETEDSVIKSTLKLSTWFKRSITAAILAGTVGPALSVLYIVTNVALHSNTKRKYKQLLLNDLKAELKIVQEKIRDADRNGDNKAKYKLMRLETQLEASINKVVFNVNSVD